MVRMNLAAVGGLLAVVLAVSPDRVRAQNLVPGTGTPIPALQDDFEETEWSFTANAPKSSREQDRNERYPLGTSENDRWIESGKRGYPDVVRRVEPPEGGLPGSQGALLLKTLHSGVPGYRSGRMQQDDFLMNNTTGYYIPVGQSPSAVVRVYVPPFEEWEQRTGSTFGFRADLQTTQTEVQRRFFRSDLRRSKTEAYWPGFFIQLRSRRDNGRDQDSAVLLIRSDENGRDLFGPEITEPGWWTLGMAFSPDGRVHYYAGPGVDALTSEDHVASHFPYGFRAERLNTIFFNVCNRDDGRSWSTEWIIDDPTLYRINDGSD